MVQHESDGKDKQAKQPESKVESTKAVEEASAGKRELLQKEHAEAARIKQGASSGITSDFGKPEIKADKKVTKANKVPLEKKTSESKKRKTTFTIEKQKKSRADEALKKPEPEKKKFSATDAFGKPLLVDSTKMPAEKPPMANLQAEQQITHAVEAIRKATKRDDFVDTGTDERSIYAVLQSLNKSQRQNLEAEYKNKFGINLRDVLKGELSGAELDKALNLLDRPDGKADDAGRVHTLLIERSQLISGRNNDLLEADLRMTIATMNSKQIAELSNEYKQRFGQDLASTLRNDSHLSAESKKFIDVYLKGAENRSQEDLRSLLKSALESSSLPLLKEAARWTSYADREAFAKEDWCKKLDSHFINSQLDQAKEVLAHGKMSVAAIVRENTSLIGDNEKAIEASLTAMTPSEREKYSWGKTLKQTHPENMTDFDKKSIAYYEQLHSALRSAGNDSELSKWEAIIEQKSKEQKQDVNQNIESNIHWYSNDKDGILSSIAKMSAAEQSKYKDDSQFREKLDKSVTAALSAGPYRDAAQYMLDQMKCGGKPTEDLAVKIFKLASAVNVNEGAVVSEFQKALAENPSLKDKILHPSNPQEELFAKTLQKALRTALTPAEFDRYVATAFFTGEVSTVVQAELHKGVFTDNKEALLQSLASAPAYERSLLLDQNKNNSAALKLQQQMLGTLNADEKRIADFVMRQKAFKPEDKMRALLIGSCGAADELKAQLSNSTAEERHQLACDYEKKYGHAITMDFANLSPVEQMEFKKLFPGATQDARSEFNETRDNYLDTRSGYLGRGLVDSGWDGTGVQIDESVAAYARTMAKAAQRFEQLSPEQKQKFAEQVGTVLTLYRESKDSVAEAGVDTLLAAGAIAAAPYTGGVSLGYLIAAAGLTGATLNVAGKIAMQGENYDWSASALGKDIAIGFVKGAANMLGPAEVARMLKVGDAVASKCASETLKRAASAGMEKVLAKGSEKTLDQAMKDLIHNAVAAGSDHISKKSIMELSQKLVSTELSQKARQSAAEHLAAVIEGSLETEFKSACKHTAGRAFKEIGLNSAASAVGGGASAASESLLNMDARKSASENLANVGEAALKGAALAAGLAAGLSSSKHLVKGVINNMKKGAMPDSSVRSDWYREDPSAPMLDYKKQRTLTTEGKEYPLYQRVEGSPWFYGPPREKAASAIVEIRANSPEELGKIQEALLPALENPKSPLHKLASDYRTIDPRFGKEHWDFDEWTHLPDGQRYDGIGFSIAVETAKQAQELQKLVGDLLKSKGLTDNAASKAGAKPRISLAGEKH